MVSAMVKKASKRMTCHKKYKIRKKVREHNKKLAKTLKDSAGKKKRTEGTVPNSAPFKEELLLEAVRQTEERKEEKKSKKKQPQIITKKAVVVGKAAVVGKKQVSAAAVIAQCDVVLWVVDVRSANECLCPEVQDSIKEADKTTIFLLNKIDLVPLQIVKKWYSVLSSVAPCFLLKSTEVLLTECEQVVPALKQVLARHAGTRTLLKHLKHTRPTEETKVGVIGTKQVGKSCVVSTILRGCGRTKAKRSESTKLSENIKLFTTPGLIGSEKTGMLHVMDDMARFMNYAPGVLRALSAVISKEQAMLHFTLPEYKHPEEFLDALAVRYNTVSGTKPDYAACGRLVLKHFRDKHLKFYVDTPCDKVLDLPEEMVGEVEKFLFQGDALRLTISHLDIVIEKREKKKKGTQMETVEEEDEEEGSEMGSEEEEELLESEEEMS